MSNFGPDMQVEIYSRGLTQPGDSGSLAALPVSFEDWEAKAREVLSDNAYWYVAGGAGAGSLDRVGTIPAT